MRCHEFEDRLHRLLDERRAVGNDPQLAAHARRCPECRALLRGQETLARGLAELRTPPVPASFAAQVVAAALAAPRPAPAPRGVPRWWLAAAAVGASAAAAALVVAAVWLARQPDLVPRIASSGRPRPAVVQRRLPKRGQLAIVRSEGAASSDVVTPSDRAASSEGSTTAPFGAADGSSPSSAEWLIEAPRLPEHIRGSLDELATRLPETVQRLEEVESLAPGLRPIRASLSLMWGTIRQTVPGMQQGDQAPPGDRSHRAPLAGPAVA